MGSTDGFYPDFDLRLDQVIVKSPQDVDRAAKALNRLIDRKDMCVGICPDISTNAYLVDADGNDINRQIFCSSNGNAEWWRQKGLALASGLARACRCESEPMWYDSTGIYSKTYNEYLSAIEIEEDSALRKSGLPNSGILIPTHLPFGQISLAICAPKDTTTMSAGDAFNRYAEPFAAIIRRFVASYSTVTRRYHRIPVNGKLSKRQVACLHWAAIGKTDQEIAMIIGISHATVRKHIDKASEVLNSSNKGHSIFRAAQLGYLGQVD